MFLIPKWAVVSQSIGKKLKVYGQLSVPNKLGLVDLN
jgi:hypothetical protein